MPAFGMYPDIVEPVDAFAVSKVFGQLAKGWNVFDKFELAPMSDAVFVGEIDDGSTLVSIKDSDEIMQHALEGDWEIVKMRLAAKVLGSHTPFAFTINRKLQISGLRFPKPEKGQEHDATFVINAAICQAAADIVVAIANHKEQ